MKDLNVGDKVWMDGFTNASMAQQNAGVFTVEKVEYRYDTKTGEKYKVYKVGSFWFGIDGNPISQRCLYYIEELGSQNNNCECSGTECNCSSEESKKERRKKTIESLKNDYIEKVIKDSINDFSEENDKIELEGTFKRNNL